MAAIFNQNNFMLRDLLMFQKGPSSLYFVATL